MKANYYANLGLNEPWSILPEYAQSYFPVLAQILKGEAPSFDSADNSSQRILNRSFFITSEDESFDEENSNTDLDEAPAGAIAVLSLNGPVMKYSQFCGPKGTIELTSELKRIYANPNFTGVLFKIESGGGQSYAPKPLTDMMDRRNKPIVVLGGNYVASAAYGIAVHADEIVIDHPRAVIGSLGTMQNIQDMQPALEKMGVAFHEIYATESILKNNTFNQARKGKYNLTRSKWLDPLNQDFIADVKAQRPAISDNKEIFQGETYMASEALELKMIDHLGDQEFAIQRLKELAKAKPKSNANNSNQNMKLFPNVEALAGIVAPTAEQIDLANANLTTNGITGSTIVPESFITEAAAVTSQVSALQVEKTNLTVSNKTLTDEVAAEKVKTANLQSKFDGLQSKFDALGGGPGATHKKPVGEDDPSGAEDETTPDAVISSLSHNKAAEEYLS